MPRIKITGFIDTDSMPAEYLDPSDPTGLTDAGFRALFYDGGDYPLCLYELEDVDSQWTE